MILIDKNYISIIYLLDMATFHARTIMEDIRLKIL